MESGDAVPEPRRSWWASPNRSALLILLAISLVPRVYRVNAPFLDAWFMRDLLNHAIARNFHDHGINLLWPESDFTPDQRNYMGMEVPVVPAVAALGWRVFGMQAWVPRAFSILASLVSVAAFFLLMQRFLTREGAFAAALFFALCPLNAYLSRKFMADPLALCLCLLSMLLSVEWVDRGKVGALVGATLCGAAAGLVKPPIIHFGLALVWYLWFREGWAGFRDWRVLVAAAAVLLPLPVWMHHMAAVRAVYWGVGTNLESGMWFSWHTLLWPKVWSLFADRFTKDILTPFGIVGLAVGLPLIRRRSDQWFLVAWLLAALAYFLVVLGGNARQAYYQLWLVPPCAGIVGYAWQMLRQHVPESRRVTPLMVAGLVVWCGWGLQPRFEPEEAVLRAGAALRQVDPGRSWVVVYPAGYNVMYYLGRQGWCGCDVLFPHPWEAPGNPEYILQRVRRGARFCVIFTATERAARRDFEVEDWLARRAQRVYHDPGFDIYRLDRSLLNTRGARQW